ncbi:uncharacterized protein LOC119079536 [Bradysia coprophila]|uniref:uncharacterized protein LOC119079536 n=1 Tax=Bradysia coprophila TaxID=38358 RepID=UPI00187DB9F8|nr:uncharacterized protein LOC119079536 [Bradysia coprophila]
MILKSLHPHYSTMSKPKSRHIDCKMPTSYIPRRLTPAPAPKKVMFSADGIIHQVQKVSADVSELQRNMAVESEARNDLQLCVEKLKAENEATKKYFAQGVADVTSKDSGGVKRSLHLLMKTLPCKSLVELDWLLAYILIRSSHWVEYIKLLGGSDFNSSIKIVLDAIMIRSVQKELSWTGKQSKKPSLKFKYKEIVDGVHMAMNEMFTDYTIAKGEAKIYSLLKNASKK